jgi:diguanylate cyclase (GGDEF)-like protein
MYNILVSFAHLLFVAAVAVVIILLSKRIIHFRKLSETDLMTSLMNYRGLCRNIEKFINYKMPFTLAIIDIDNFRIFNKQSYKLGDDVLKEFAALLNQSFRDTALIARFRIGDEFIIVFKHINSQKAKMNIDELKEKCNHYNFISLENFPAHTLTFSEGIVEMNSEIITIDALFTKAEKSLKKNKEQK